MMRLLSKALSKLGYSIIRTSNAYPLVHYPPDIEDQFKTLYEECKPYTLTSIERMYSLYKAVEYVVKYDIPGDMVECGVWKGGSSMLIASTLLMLDDTQRNIYLYDTYAGMSAPTVEDVDYIGDQPQIDVAQGQIAAQRQNLATQSFPQVV